jgi:hypothetical protein
MLFLINPIKCSSTGGYQQQKKKKKQERNSFRSIGYSNVGQESFASSFENEKGEALLEIGTDWIHEGTRMRIPTDRYKL